MRKIDQTIVCKDHGNCFQAAVASLLDLKLHQVPNFIQYKEKYMLEFLNFMSLHGYTDVTPYGYTPGDNKPNYFEVAAIDKGVDCYFLAVVPSKNFKGVTHAVIVNQDMQVIHDPNPNRKALEYGPEDIIEIMTMRNGWHISVDGKIVDESFIYENS